MITDTTIGLLPDDRYLRPTCTTGSGSGSVLLELIPPGRLVLTGERAQLYDLLASALTALYAGETTTTPARVSARWQFGAMGMEEVTDDDDE